MLFQHTPHTSNLRQLTHRQCCVQTIHVIPSNSSPQCMYEIYSGLLHLLLNLMFFLCFLFVELERDDHFGSTLMYLQLSYFNLAQPSTRVQIFDEDIAMDSLVALDAQIISQLRDTNIQINRLMVLQLNRLHDTIRQLQLAETDTNNPDPRLPGRIQQLQTLLPSIKATVEHQQTFYHQCLRLQHIPTTLQHQVLRLATTLDKATTTSTSTFERSNTPPSPRQPKTDPTSLTTNRSTIRLQERPHHPQHHKLSEQPLLVWQHRTSSAASHSHSAKHTRQPPQRSRSHSRHTRKKRQVAAPRRHSDRTSPPRIDRHNSPHSHSTRSPQQLKHFTKHTKHRKQPKRSQHSTTRSRRSPTRRSLTTKSRKSRHGRSTRSTHYRSSCRTRRQLSPAPTRTHSPSPQTEHHTSRHSSRASPTTRPDHPAQHHLLLHLQRTPATACSLCSTHPQTKPHQTFQQHHLPSFHYIQLHHNYRHHHHRKHHRFQRHHEFFQKHHPPPNHHNHHRLRQHPYDPNNHRIHLHSNYFLAKLTKIRRHESHLRHHISATYLYLIILFITNDITQPTHFTAGSTTSHLQTNNHYY